MAKMLRTAVTVTATASSWLILHFGGRGLVDDGSVDSQGPPIFVLVMTLIVPIGLALLARYRYRRCAALPANIDDVYGITRTIAIEDGVGAEGLVPFLLGVTIGSAAAVLTTVAQLRVGMLGFAVGAALITLGIVREVRSERGAVTELHDRISRVRGHGTRVVAEVIEIGFGGLWFHGGPVIRVTARFHTSTGMITVTDDIATEPADVPTPGGTVLVWYIGKGERRQDFYMEQDTDSIREPGAEERYRSPDAAS